MLRSLLAGLLFLAPALFLLSPNAMAQETAEEKTDSSEKSTPEAVAGALKFRSVGPAFMSEQN